MKEEKEYGHIVMNYDYTSLYGKSVQPTYIDLVRINRQITIDNIENDTDNPTYESVVDYMGSEFLRMYGTARG